MAKTFFAAVREGDGAIQTMMAANAPVLIQRAMVEGRPDEGVLPSGQVAAVIGALPPVAELIDSIVSEAEARLAAVQANCRRSEEHTSELQSLMRISYAVFCLKKNNQRTTAQYNRN